MSRVAVGLVLLLGAGWACTPTSGDVGFGPPVAAGVPWNSRLTDTLRTVVQTDDPTVAIDASITAKVVGNGDVLATLGPYAVHATGMPQRVDMPLPDYAVDRIKLIGGAVAHPVGTVFYTVAITNHTADGPPTFAYHEQSPISLFAPIHSSRPVAVAVRNNSFNGSPQVANGTVSLPALEAWPRTSVAGRSIETYGPIAITTTCSAYLLAVPTLIAIKHPSAYFDFVGGIWDTVRSGALYRVSVATPTEPLPGATATGLVRVAPRRYAGLRVHVSFDPGCTQSAGRSTTVVDGLAKAARGLTARLRIKTRH